MSSKRDIGVYSRRLLDRFQVTIMFLGTYYFFLLKIHLLLVLYKKNPLRGYLIYSHVQEGEGVGEGDLNMKLLPYEGEF